VKLAEDLDWDFLVKKTEGYSGNDIANVCREAALMPMRRKIVGGGVSILDLVNMKDELEAPLSMDDFKDALKNIQKSVSSDHLEEYAKWMAEFGSQ